MNKKLSEGEKIKNQTKKDISEAPLKSGNTIKLPDILGGIIFISTGVILLLNNFAVIPWAIWLHLTPFWPVVFVFIGLDLISGNSLLLKAITTFVGVFIFAFIIFYSLSAVNPAFKKYLNNHCKYFQNILSFIQRKTDANSSGLYYMDTRNGDRQYPVFRD